MSTRSVHLVGPMTGHPSYNFDAFERARQAWECCGYRVTTPFDANNAVWQKRHGRPFMPHADTGEYGDPVLAECFAEGVRLLCLAEMVAVLPGWERSRGTGRELAIATLLGRRVFDAVTFDEMHLLATVSVEQVPAGGCGA